MGSRVGSTYLALHRTWLVSAIFAGCHCCSGRCFMFYCATFRPYSWRPFGVSPTPACPLRVTPVRGCSLGICVACDWLDLLSSSSLFQDSVICADLWPRQSGPDTSCDRLSVALALSPSITVVMAPCYCGMLGGLHVLVGSSTSPSLGRMLGPSSIGLWRCCRLGCRPVPSSHFLDSVYYLACSLDSSSYGFLR